MLEIFSFIFKALAFNLQSVVELPQNSMFYLIMIFAVCILVRRVLNKFIFDMLKSLFLLAVVFSFLNLRSFIVSFFTLVEEGKIEFIVLVYLFDFLILLSLIWFMIRLSVAIIFDKDLDSAIAVQLAKFPVSFKVLGLCLFLILVLSVFTELRIFHLIFLLGLIFKFAYGVKEFSFSLFLYEFGAAVVQPRSLCFFFFLLQLNFVTFLFFDVFVTFQVICLPLALLCGIPEDFMASNSSEQFNLSQPWIFAMKPLNKQVFDSNENVSLAEKLVKNFWPAYLKAPSKIATNKTVHMIYQGKTEVPLKVTEYWGIANKLIVKEYIKSPEKYQQEYPEYFHGKFLASLSSKELRFLLDNPLEVLTKVEELAEQPVVGKEIVKGILSEASYQYPRNLIQGLLGQELAQLAFKALYANERELGKNPVFTFILSDTNRIVQCPNPLAAFSKDFSSQRIACGINELATAVIFGESQGGTLEVGRSVLGDACVKTKEMVSVLSIKENGRGVLSEALGQVDKASKNVKLKELHTKESADKCVNTYAVVTAGSDFTKADFNAQDNNIKKMAARFNKEWKQNFEVKNLGKK